MNSEANKDGKPEDDNECDWGSRSNSEILSFRLMNWLYQDVEYIVGAGHAKKMRQQSLE